MTKLYKNIFRMAGMFLPAVVAIFTLASCNDDDEKESLGTLDSPVVSIVEVTPNTINFVWTEVEGARQYCYRVINPNGKEVKAGVTQNCDVTASKLQPITLYTIEVTAFPTVIGSANNSEVSSISARTTFYSIVESTEGTYTSSLLNADGESWSATLVEDRSAEDYEEETFGVFTLSNFYDRASGKIIFTVNKDNTITIQNATDHDNNGWAGVKTGRPQSAYKTLYIDESSSVFDRANKKLTYSAKFASSDSPQTDTFTW